MSNIHFTATILNSKPKDMCNMIRDKTGIDVGTYLRVNVRVLHFNTSHFASSSNAPSTIEHLTF